MEEGDYPAIEKTTESVPKLQLTVKKMYRIRFEDGTEAEVPEEDLIEVDEGDLTILDE